MGVEAAVPQLQPLPAQDDHSDEDTLNPPLHVPTLDEIRARLAANTGNLVRGVGGKPRGSGPNKVPCAASVSEAIIEDRG